MRAEDVKQALQELANEKKAITYQRFFKTGKGEYGEGDKFIGVTVPQQRRIAKHHQELPLHEATKLLASPIHEHRLTGLIIMTEQYRKGDEKNKQAIYEAYLDNRQGINNWDLIDITAPRIVGAHLLDKDRSILYELARGTLWEKRIAIIATYAFIRAGETEDTIKLAERYLDEKHDLTHKATGWMLREVGKRAGQEALEGFLRRHHEHMPRTMLRYAIERFPEERRKAYLKGRPPLSETGMYK